MNIKVFNFMVSKCGWKENGGGYCETFSIEAEQEVNDFLAYLYTNSYVVKDIKINHYVTERHNNAGYDEVWVQYTILFH